MESSTAQEEVSFEVVWQNVDHAMREEVVCIWRQRGIRDADADKRLDQLAVLMRNGAGKIVGISTAYKTYIRQLRNYLFACRLFIIPEYRGGNLSPQLLVRTRDLFESVHQHDVVNPAIGLITLVENDYVRRRRNDAIWPNSKMVFIGNSREGHPIRVYYFKGARIVP